MSDWQKKALGAVGGALKKGGEIAGEKIKEAQEFQAEQAAAAKEKADQKQEAEELGRRVLCTYEVKNGGLLHMLKLNVPTDTQEKSFKSSAVSKYTMVTHRAESSIVLSMFNGGVLTFSDDQNYLGGGASLWDLGNVETANYFHWNNEQPRAFKGSSGVIVETEFQIWEVAATNFRTGKRRVFMHSHCPRDFAFMVTNRLNMLLGHAREVLAPWKEEMTGYYRTDIKSPDDVEEDRAGMQERLKERIESWGAPDWDWN